MSTNWTIVRAADTSELVVAHHVTDSASVHPKDAGCAWDDTLLAVQLSAVPNPSTQTWNGGEWVDVLPELRERAIDRVNAGAEAMRAKYLTPGTGQAMTYQRKELEARAWTQGAEVTSFPFLNAEAQATGEDVQVVAASVVAQADAWVVVGAAIEGARRGAVVAIEAAQNRADIASAAQVDWASLAP